MSSDSQPTFTTSTSSSPSNTRTSQPQPQPQLFNSSSLVFGFIFLAIIIIVLGSGCLWQRYMQTRRGGMFAGRVVVTGLGRTTRGGVGDKEKPKLWDVYLGRREGFEEEDNVVKGKGRSESCVSGGWLNVQDGSWMGMKPLSMQLLSPKLDEHNGADNLSQEPPLPQWQNRLLPLRPSARTPLRAQQTASNPTQPRSTLPSLIPSRWRRTAHSPSTTPPHAQSSSPSNHTSPNNEKHGPASHIELHAPGNASSTTKTEIRVAVVIAMPSPSKPVASQRLRLGSAADSGSSTSIEATKSTNAEIRPLAHPLQDPSSNSFGFGHDHDDTPDELVYELGVTVASVHADPRACGFGSDEKKAGKVLSGSESDGNINEGS